MCYASFFLLLLHNISSFRDLDGAWTSSPVPTAQVPDWFALRWPPPPGARRGGDALAGCFGAPILPLHTEMFPHRPRRRVVRWRIGGGGKHSWGTHSHLATWKSFLTAVIRRRRTRRLPIDSLLLRRGRLARRHHEDDNQGREWGGGAQGGQQLQGGTWHRHSKHRITQSPLQGGARSCGV